MNSNKLRIALDSSVFRDSDFITFLKLNLSKLEISISIIVIMETFHWFNIRKISKSSFNKMINSLNPKIISLTENHIEDISNNVILSKLNFKHHNRDVIIATHALQEKATIVTSNIKHFSWMQKKPLLPMGLVGKVIN